MQKVQLTLLGLLALAFASSPIQAEAQAGADAALASAGALTGRVLGESSPLQAARVYAYQLADLSLRQVATDATGSFLFDALPAGLYKIIAHKTGFVPAVVMLTRATAEARQFVELELTEEKTAEGGAGEDFWAVRSAIPSDVLRQITAADRLALAAPGTELALPLEHFETQMQAMTGYDQIASAGEAQVTGGQVGIQGRLGEMTVGVKGNYWQLEPAALGKRATTGLEAGGGGQASVLSFDLASRGDARVNFTSRSNRLITMQDGIPEPVDFEHFRLSWSQPMGDNAHSNFTAGYTSETNYYRQATIDPVEIPESSRTWHVEGSYTRELNERATIETGLRYREREVDLASFGPGAFAPAQERVDLFGRGGWRVEPSVLVEYGLYTTLRDGSLSLIPHGGVVLQVAPQWQLAALASHGVRNLGPSFQHDFTPILFGDRDACEQGEESCYKVMLSRESDDQRFSLSAVQREFGETLRLYFSNDFFNHLESLYLVQGDRLPEVQLAVSHHLTPTIVTELEADAASGGGGVFSAGPYDTFQNKVSYLVTSLDTHFQTTSTGVFIAFHQLDQQLDPLGLPDGNASDFRSERLQLLVTQDLNVLISHLAADWALQLNMELSRGTTPFSPSSGEPRRRILGGFAVKF